MCRAGLLNWMGTYLLYPAGVRGSAAGMEADRMAAGGGRVLISGASVAGPVARLLAQPIRVPRDRRGDERKNFASAAAAMP